MTEKVANSVPVIRDVYPYLCVRDAAAALEFYTRLEAVSPEEIKQRFEAEQRERVGS